MGMFDWVAYETDCPYCKSRVKGFQTKNCICLCETVSPMEAMEFYSSCDKCKAWVEVEVLKPSAIRYKQEWREGHEKESNPKTIIDESSSYMDSIEFAVEAFRKKLQEERLKK